MEDWEAKHKERGTKLTAQAFKAIYKELGGEFGTASALCHPRQDREKCKRFKKTGIN